MKRSLCSFLTIMLAALTLTAQKYEPNTRWPYIYEDFVHGTIFFEGNQKSEADMNIHLAGNILHFVDANGRIMKSEPNKVIRVEIGSDAFLYNGGRLMQILSNSGNNVLLMLTRADFGSMNSSGGAYGSSLNSSASVDLSSLDLGGLDNPEMGRMLQEKNEGRVIPVVKEYYFIIDGRQVDTSKKSIEKIVGDRVAEWKSFLKENKIKWKDAESLKKVLDFISQK